MSMDSSAESLLGFQIPETDQEYYELAFESSGIGIWNWNLETDEIYFSTGWKSILPRMSGERNRQ